MTRQLITPAFVTKLDAMGIIDLKGLDPELVAADADERFFNDFTQDIELLRMEERCIEVTLCELNA